MARTWKNRPPGSNWGDFGPDDELGRLNLITPEKIKQGIAEVEHGRTFCLSMPLDYPGGSVLNPRRRPPEFHPVRRGGQVAFNMALADINPHLTSVTCDDAVLIHLQYSTQWDSLAHMGSAFDADGDGKPEHVFYNGHSVLDERTGAPLHGDVGASKLGIEKMAAHGVQGRGVLLDLHAHFGRARRHVGYDDIMGIMESDGVEVEQGDMVLMHTGFGDLLLELNKSPDAETLRNNCCVLDGWDDKLLQWISDSGLSVLISDNYAVEDNNREPAEITEDGPLLPLHEHCLFKIGVHLGELWYLGDLARWLKENGRSRFLLTAPPLRLPGAVGSPATPVATV